MTPSRWQVLLGLFLVPAVVVWLLLESLYAIPPLPWTAVPTLLLLALGELYTALNIRSRMRSRTLPDIGALTVARFAALGKASSHAAAVFGGIFTGVLLHVAGDLEFETPRANAWVSGATAVSALVLVGAALFLEYSCRIPKDQDDNDRLPPAPEPPTSHH